VLACCHDIAGVGVLGNLAQGRAGLRIEDLAAKRAKILEKGVHFPMCSECNDLYRLARDNPPPGRTLNEWIYRLYESEDSRQASLTEALRLLEEELAGAQVQLDSLAEENARLGQAVSGYEQMRVIRLLRWLNEQRHRFPK
jgi:hypothetical protein